MTGEKKIQRGKQIRLMREKAGFKQYEFADAIGKNKCFVCSVENGKRSPSLDNLKQMCDVCGDSLQSFFKYFV